MPLSLHQLTALDVGPVELIEISARLGVSGVCLFTHVPEAAAGRYPLVRGADVPDVRAALDDAGLVVANLEVFPLDRSGGRDDFTPGLTTGAALGATRATAHLHDVLSEQEAVDRFALFAENAAAHGIVAGLEFNAFSAVRDLASGERIVRAAGCGSLVLDLLHTVRGGSTGRDVARAADLIGYVQLCDGPADMPADGRWREALSERQIPGEGDFPLSELLKPLGSDLLFDVEVPQSGARKAGVPAFERARRAVEASRCLLARIDEERAQ